MQHHDAFTEQMMALRCRSCQLNDSGQRRVLDSKIHQVQRIVDQTRDPLAVAEGTMEYIQHEIALLSAIIGRVERRERRVLLELAVWKMVCIHADQRTSFCMTNDWLGQGWKNNKKTLRDANEIGIVSQLVEPYLD
jgi:hypothetical protein